MENTFNQQKEPMVAQCRILRFDFSIGNSIPQYHIQGNEKAEARLREAKTNVFYQRRCVINSFRTPKCSIEADAQEPFFFRKAFEALVLSLRGYIQTIAEEKYEAKRNILQAFQTAATPVRW